MAKRKYIAPGKYLALASLPIWSATVDEKRQGIAAQTHRHANSKGLNIPEYWMNLGPVHGVGVVVAISDDQRLPDWFTAETPVATDNTGDRWRFLILSAAHQVRERRLPLLTGCDILILACGRLRLVAETEIDPYRHTMPTHNACRRLYRRLINLVGAELVAA